MDEGDPSPCADAPLQTQRINVEGTSCVVVGIIGSADPSAFFEEAGGPSALLAPSQRRPTTTQFIEAVLQPLASHEQHTRLSVLLKTLQLKAVGPLVLLEPDPASLPLQHATPDDELVGCCEHAVAAWTHTAREAVYARHTSVPEGEGCLPLLQHSRAHAATLRALAHALQQPVVVAAVALVEQHSHDTALVQAAQVWGQRERMCCVCL